MRVEGFGYTKVGGCGGGATWWQWSQLPDNEDRRLRSVTYASLCPIRSTRFAMAASSGEADRTVTQHEHGNGHPLVHGCNQPKTLPLTGIGGATTKTSGSQAAP